MPDVHLSLILPTRGRPRLLERFFASLLGMAHRPDELEVIMYVDDDDHSTRSDEIPMPNHTKIIGPRETMGRMIRKCVETARGRMIMLINDDAVFRVPAWDLAVIDAVDRYPDGVVLAWCNDLFRKESMPNFPVMSRSLCELMGGTCPGEYRRDYVDVHLFDIFQKLRAMGHDRLVYLSDVIVEHLHHEAGKAGFDETYHKPRMADDELEYIAWDTRRRIVARSLAAHIQGFQ